MTRTTGLFVPATRSPQFPVPKTPVDVSATAYQEYLKSAEREYLRAVLVMSGYSMGDTAAILGIG